MATSNNHLIKFKSILFEFCSFIKPYRALLNDHNVQFLVDNHWQKFNDYDSTLVKSLEYIVFTKNNKNLLKYAFNHNQSSNEQQCVIFHDILDKLQHLNTLWTDDVLTNLNDLKETLKISELNNQTYSDRKVSERFMKVKKTHEVDEMSYLISKLCKHLNITNIVDIGSGKGYLSAQLSHLYDLNVIAIDSSKTNVNNAIERLNKMKRQTNLKLDNLIPNDKATSEDQQTLKFQTFNELIHINTNLIDLIDKRLSINLKEKNYSIIGLHTCGELASSLIKLYLNNKSYSSNDNRMILLCNVACCYHLLNEKYAPDCYNYVCGDIEDKQSMSNSNAKIENEVENIEMNDSKFPMCSLLNELKFYLGRNSRMISSQPIDRLLTLDEIYDRGLWYRSVLQVILKDVFNLDGVNIKVGKLAPKCENFRVYVRKALNKLKLDNLKINDNDIDAYWNKYLYEQEKFKIYFQFKLLFSPLIEHIVLLDRLIYLFENTVNSESYLIQLFNPVTSPRCYALVSF